ncbi:MAG: nucleotidyltransferase family protein [Pseudomonadota bacterium]
MIGILLAAGYSRRFGMMDKLLQPLPDGRPIAIASAESLIQAIPTCIAVLRAENQVLAESLLSRGFNLVFCDEDKQEMADSLATAIHYSAQFPESNDGFVIALADMPYIHTSTISAVAGQLNAGAAIVIPTYQGQRGHPVGFSAKFRNELESLQGDEGARSIIKRHSNAVTLIACEDAGILADIDTPADLKQAD